MATLKLIDDPAPLSPPLNDIAGMMHHIADQIAADTTSSFENVRSVLWISVNGELNIGGIGCLGAPLDKLQLRGSLMKAIEHIQTMLDPERTNT